MLFVFILTSSFPSPSMPYTLSSFSPHYPALCPHSHLIISCTIPCRTHCLHSHPITIILLLPMLFVFILTSSLLLPFLPCSLSSFSPHYHAICPHSHLIISCTITCCTYCLHSHPITIILLLAMLFVFILTSSLLSSFLPYS